MEIVLDSVSLKHLLRKPRPIRQRRRLHSYFGQTNLDEHIRQGNLFIALDTTNVLMNEWERTCGEEEIRVLITNWHDLNGLRLFGHIPSLDCAVKRTLRHLGLSGTVDFFLVRLTNATGERNLVSDDHNFWEPGNTASKGNDRAPVAAFLSGELGIRTLLLGQLMRLL